MPAPPRLARPEARDRDGTLSGPVTTYSRTVGPRPTSVAALVNHLANQGWQSVRYLTRCSAGPTPPHSFAVDLHDHVVSHGVTARTVAIEVRTNVLSAVGTRAGEDSEWVVAGDLWAECEHLFTSLRRLGLAGYACPFHA
jgi:hypothetical protein